MCILVVVHYRVTSCSQLLRPLPSQSFCLPPLPTLLPPSLPSQPSCLPPLFLASLPSFLPPSPPSCLPPLLLASLPSQPSCLPPPPPHLDHTLLPQFSYGHVGPRIANDLGPDWQEFASEQEPEGIYVCVRVCVCVCVCVYVRVCVGVVRHVHVLVVCRCVNKIGCMRCACGSRVMHKMRVHTTQKFVHLQMSSAILVSKVCVCVYVCVCVVCVCVHVCGVCVCARSTMNIS